MNELFRELKRRNVFKVGVAYVIVAWVILQFIDVVSGIMNFPEWFAQAVLIILGVGLPVALIASWAYEVTPKGVMKTKDVDKSKSITHGTGQRINKLIAVGLVLALGFIAYDKLIAPGTTVQEAEAGQVSIAVLPFADLSPEGDQEYFSDGISEEILNVLAKIPELRVAARTSSFQFKGENKDIQDIARQLSVGFVLEGSVRKQGNQVRITAQLIDASNGFHLWSENYDRSLENIFAVQDEISNAIVGELKTAMGLAVTSEIRAAQVTTPEAYDLYLLGVHQMEKRGAGPLSEAAGYFEQVLEIDPDYVPAIARLATTYLLLPLYDFQNYPSGTMRPKGETLARRALELAPDLPESQAAMGFFFFQSDFNDEAEPYLKRALELNPSYTNVKVWMAGMLEETGRYDETLFLEEQIVRDDPLSPLAVNNLVADYLIRGRFEKAAPLLERLRTLSPVFYYTTKTFEFRLKGQNAEGALEALKALKLDPNSSDAKDDLSDFLSLGFGLYQEDIRLGFFPFDSVILSGQVEVAKTMLEQVMQLVPGDDPFFNELIGAAFLTLGDFENGQIKLDKARDLFPNLEVGVVSMSNAGFLAHLYILQERENVAEIQDIITYRLADIERKIRAGIIDATDPWHRGFIRLYQGERNAALEDFEDAVAKEYWPSSFDYYLFQQFPEVDFEEILAPYYARVEEDKAAFLKIVCNDGSPAPEVWTPMPETCEGYVEGAK